MGQVAGNPGEFSLGSLNDSTGWLASFDAASDATFTIRGTFNGTVALQTSDQADHTKTRVTTIATYTAIAGPLSLPRVIAGWFRLIMTAYTSGTAYVGIGAPTGPSGTPIRLAPQMETNAPAVDSFT